MDKDHVEELAKLPGYTMRLSSESVDGWLVFCGEHDAEGPWMFVNADMVNEKCEDLGNI